MQHLTVLGDADVKITLEIHAQLPQGAPDDIVRVVTENARMLKFKNYGFEDGVTLRGRVVPANGR